MDKFERTKVTITRITSPSEFSVKLLSNQQSQHVRNTPNANTRAEYLSWIRDRTMWKCHLAFLAPNDNISWSKTAIDKFKQYTEQFIEYAITIPSVASPSSLSTGVILWSLHQDNDTEVNALEAEHYTWQNINLKIIYQGVARPTVHIELFNRSFLLLANIEKVKLNDQIAMANRNGGSQTDVINRKKDRRATQWLPTDHCRFKQFVGVPVFIDSNLTIYVQEWEHQKCVEHFSNELTKWHAIREKIPSKSRWKKGEICVVKRNDGIYYRAEIQKIYGKKRKFLVEIVDFGYKELVDLNQLSTHIKFTEVPLQVRKLRLFNVIFNSDKAAQATEAVEFTNKLILHQNCSFYIYDNFDSPHFDSILCAVRPINSQLDLTTQLISNGLAQYGTFLHKENGNENENHKSEKFDTEKRIRKVSDESLLINSCDLETFDDFKSFYENHKTVIPPIQSNDTHGTYVDDDDDDRKFEVFERPCKRSPLNENKPFTKPDTIRIQPNPIVDRILEHFEMLQLNAPIFYCRPLYIIDPITILIVPMDANPLIIEVPQQEKYFPLQEYQPCIAFMDRKWHRGIVWEKKSTNKYRILFVDSLKIFEVARKFIQRCPNELLHSKLQFAKVHLSKIKPNERLRTRDICDELSKRLFSGENCDELYAKFVGIRGDGVPDIKLYFDDNSKTMIYDCLIRDNFYKKI